MNRMKHLTLSVTIFSLLFIVPLYASHKGPYPIKREHGGFEGDKVHDKGSPFYGQRMVGGWRHEGLPWTYKMDPKLMYYPDVKR